MNPQFSVVVILYIVCSEAIVTTSRASTLWTLNEERTRIVPKEPGKGAGDPFFSLVAGAQRQGGAWMLRGPHCLAR